MMRIEWVFWICGALLIACALRDLRLRRYAYAAFWIILGATLLAGEPVQAALAGGNALPAQLTGAAVIALALIAGSGKLRRGAEVHAPPANPRGNVLFVPALVIPLGTVALILLHPYLRIGDASLLDPKQPTLTELCLACVIIVDVFHLPIVRLSRVWFVWRIQLHDPAVT